MTNVNQKDIEALSRAYHELINAYHKGQRFFCNKLKGLTMAEVSVLEIVDQRPNVILKEILDILQIPNSTLTNIINRLEKKDLIRRVINPRDRRSFGLELTSKGVEAQEEHRQDEKRLFMQLLEPLEEDERRAFINSLEKVARNLEQS